MWQSILKAHCIIRGDAWWCIGTCNSILILNEPWLVNGDQIDENILGAQ